MALDEAILRAAAAGEAPPTVRFYAWEPPALSLGRGQRAADVDLDALVAAGYGLVRRPTGGKAILHIDELTYAVAAPRADPRMTGTVGESYCRLSAGLVLGLERLGADGIAADRRARQGGASGPICFEVASDYELTHLGRKLIGSAQMRADGAVLQHGALPLYGDIARICALLRSRPDPGHVRARATTVEEALQRRVGWGEAAEALASGFGDALNVRLERGEPTERELTAATALHAEKYSTDWWTYRL
jgi:lipoate-protein ligase A